MSENLRDLGHGKDPGPTISRTVSAPVEAVWTVLADGWPYANWVVGAARVRDVDPGWPAVGSRVHHSLGLWPVEAARVTRTGDARITHADFRVKNGVCR